VSQRDERLSAVISVERCPSVVAEPLLSLLYSAYFATSGSITDRALHFVRGVVTLAVMKDSEKTASLSAGNAATAERLGLIGIGLMGTAMAERLLAFPFAVCGWDIDLNRRNNLVSLGGQIAGSAAEVATACRRIIVSLPDSDIVGAVLAEIEPALRSGQIVIDTTTGEPEQAAAAAKRLSSRGVTYLDAAISGSSAQVTAGEVSVMAGGPAEAFAQCGDLFAAFARQAFHLGPSGSGAKMKLVTNLVLGINRAALAEGLSLAGALGLDLAQALKLLRESMAYSRIMDTKGERMISGDFRPQARLSQHLKDVRLMLSAAGRAGMELPLSEAHRALLEQAEAAGYGQSDNAAVIRAYRRG
jgi:3-hydroxyisobutyrate dehydrogenase-like beta-hydroxyacid dehydrogenase